MLSAFAQRLSPVILRTYALSKVTASFQSRSFVATPLLKEHPAKPNQPFEARKDATWDVLANYSKKMVAPRLSSEEIWRARSDRLVEIPPPSIYAGSLPFMSS